jgi:PLP dependent protein
MTDARSEAISHNLDALEARITSACAAANRTRDDITLIAVTKTFPPDDVRRLAGLGVRDIGENRDQEAAEKASALTDVDVRWHFVGRLQTNKCRSVATYAHAVHSVDRPPLVDALAGAARKLDRSLDVFVQVSLDGDPARGGADAADVSGLADDVVAAAGLRLAGVMAVAPLGSAAAPAFERLAEIAARVRADHPSATAISAGMSGDLEAAIAAGATHVRVGTALLGVRPRVVG